MKGKYRSDFQIVYDILEVCKEDEVLLMHVSLKARLAHYCTIAKLNELIKRKLIKTIETNLTYEKNERFYYKTTQEGYMFQKAIEVMI